VSEKERGSTKLKEGMGDGGREEKEEEGGWKQKSSLG
jgi:hypothetical protein